MLIAPLDLETTGLEIGDHRIIEVYTSLWDTDTRRKLDELHLRIHPQRSIMPAAEAVHKISIMDLQGCPVWDHALASQIHAFIEQADVAIGHNGKEFDLPFLDYEFKRVGVTPLSVPIFDTMLEARWATPQGKVPNLGELCFACGVPYDPASAHKADYDVDRMTECLFNGMDWGFYQLPLIAHPKSILKEAA